MRTKTPGRKPAFRQAAARRRQAAAALRPAPVKEEGLAVEAKVIEALPNAMFALELESGHRLIGYTAGRMRRARIRITPGDRVRVEISPYDLSRGRITYRYSTPSNAAA